MLISIIIPVYNVEKYVERCLLSCVRQDLSINEYEIVVVNDGSKDNSLEIVKEISSKYKNIKIFSQENGGLSIARNVGVQNACGDYIMFLDSDDWIADNCLKKIVAICEKNDLDMLSFCAADVIGCDTPVRRFSHESFCVYEGKQRLKKGYMPICAPFSVYKRNFLIANRLSFYPSIFHEDNEFKPRAFYCASKVMDINDIVYYVYHNPDSITRTINPQKAFDLIKVCDSLHDFCMNVEETMYQVGFFYNIGLSLNCALHQTKYMNKFEKKRFNNCISEKKHLFSDLKKSHIWKYKLEGILFSVFPKWSLKIFWIMQILNLRFWKNTFSKTERVV